MKTPSIAVVVICHEAYLGFLPRCIGAIDEQKLAATQKILVLDDCSINFPLRPEWVVIRGSWKNPNKARNAGLEYVKTEWVTFADADNQMHHNYLSSYLLELTQIKFNVGVLYPSILRMNEASSELVWQKKATQYSYWKFRRQNMIDTSSMWRTDAVKGSRWNEEVDNYDDYALAVRITRQGWKGQASEAMSFLNNHGANRSNVGDKWLDSLYKISSLTVVMLVAGRDITEEIIAWVVKEKWPKEINFVFVDDSGKRNFNKRLREWVEPLYDFASSVSIVKANDNQRINDELGKWEQVHYHVSELYNQVLPGIQSEFVMTLEDDVLPPKGGAFQLFLDIASHNQVKVAVSGVYESRDHRDHAAVSMQKDAWRDMPKLEDIPKELHEVGMIPGGFSLYQNWALQLALPLTVTHTPDKIGWDGTLSKRFSSMGYPVYLDGRVICKHFI